MTRAQCLCLLAAVSSYSKNSWKPLENLQHYCQLLPGVWISQDVQQALHLTQVFLPVCSNTQTHKVSRLSPNSTLTCPGFSPHPHFCRSCWSSCAKVRCIWRAVWVSPCTVGPPEMKSQLDSSLSWGYLQHRSGQLRTHIQAVWYAGVVWSTHISDRKEILPWKDTFEKEKVLIFLSLVSDMRCTADIKSFSGKVLKYKMYKRKRWVQILKLKSDMNAKTFGGKKKLWNVTKSIRKLLEKYSRTKTQNCSKVQNLSAFLCVPGVLSGPGEGTP